MSSGSCRPLPSARPSALPRLPLTLSVCAVASNRDILKIFGFETDEDAEKLTYYTFLSMARAGVRALEWYDAKTGNHGQAHMQSVHFYRPAPYSSIVLSSDDSST